MFPKTLVNKVGLDMLVKRVPKSYLKSAFAAQVAAGFIYAKGSSGKLCGLLRLRLCVTSELITFLFIDVFDSSYA